MPSFLFDIGNVILFFDFQLAVGRISDKCKLPEAEILPALSPLTNAFERGEMDTSAFVEAAAGRIGLAGDPQQLVPALQDIFTVNEPMVALIETLQAEGHRLVLLSNTNAIHVPYFTHRYPVFGLFEGAIYSHEVGAMKPDAEIYQAAIDRFGFDPASTIYIDDMPENVAAGRALDFQAIQYQGSEHARFLATLASLNP